MSAVIPQRCECGALPTDAERGKRHTCKCGYTLEAKDWGGILAWFPAPPDSAVLARIRAIEVDHQWCDFPTCPRCGAADQDWWDGQPERNDGDSWEVECPHCDLPYRVTMSVSVSFDTTALAIENEDTHG